MGGRAPLRHLRLQQARGSRDGDGPHFPQAKGDTRGTFPTSRPLSEGHTHAWAPGTHRSRPGLQGVPLEAGSREAGQRLCPPLAPGQAPHYTHTRPLTAATLVPGGGESSTSQLQPTEIRTVAFGARIRRAGDTRGSSRAWGRAAFRPGRGDTHPLGAPAAPSSPAALGRSRRRGGAGPAAPARPPAPRGSARPRRHRQLAPRERPGARGHAPGRRGRRRRTCGRPGSARSGGGWTALRGAAAPRAPQRPLLPERARPAAHSLTRRRCASVRPRGERRAGEGASAGRAGPRGLPSPVRGASRGAGPALVLRFAVRRPVRGLAKCTGEGNRRLAQLSLSHSFKKFIKKRIKFFRCKMTNLGGQTT